MHDAKSKAEIIQMLGRIISFLKAEEYDATIVNLARDCHLPVPYIRKTLVALLNNQILAACIYPDEDLEDLDWDDLEPETRTENILNGRYDEQVFHIELPAVDSDNMELLALTPMEYSELKKRLGSDLSFKRKPLYETKTIIPPVPEEVRNRQVAIIDAIAAHFGITFSYKFPNNTIQSIHCHPVELATNVTDNRIYLYSASGQAYRLDRMVSSCRRYKESSDSQITTGEREADPNRKYIWGSSPGRDMEPQHVKLLIRNATPNILFKIKNDTRYRHDTCNLYKDGDTYYYEDDILGMSDFKKWLRGYGSAIIVLEPESIRKEILESARIALNLYEQVDQWKSL